MRRWVLALAATLAAVPAAAQNHYALEILTPAPVGAAVDGGLDADNRVFWAYPGLEYNIRVVARGGRYPYTYELTGAPSGMTISAGPCTVIGPTCTAGTITWTPADASADDASITVTVRDADGDATSKTWGIDVVDPATQTRFWFIDPVAGNAHSTNGGSGTGTAANPWLTLDDAYDGSGASDICYFRQGTLTIGNLPLVNADNVNGEERVEWNSTARCTIWLAYPGETPTIAFGYTGDGCGSTASPSYSCGQSVPRFRLSGDVSYIDGLAHTEAMTMAYQFGRTSRYGALVRRSTFTTAGPGINGGNSAFIMYIQTYGSGGTPGTQVIGDVVMNSTFNNLDGLGTIDAIKCYSWWKGVITDNEITSFTAGVSAVEAVATKADVSDFTFRSNIMTDATFGGNNDTHNTGEETKGEIYHNVFKGYATQYLGESRVDCCIGAFYVYRNTFIGTAAIQLQNLQTGDGPMTYTQNVIVNAQAASGSCPAKFQCTSVADHTVYSLVNNLTGVAADSITDANGELQGAYLTAHGPDSATPKGHMLDSSPPAPAPATPSRLRFRLALLFGQPSPFWDWYDMPVEMDTRAPVEP